MKISESENKIYPIKSYRAMNFKFVPFLVTIMAGNSNSTPHNLCFLDLKSLLQVNSLSGGCTQDQLYREGSTLQSLVKDKWVKFGWDHPSTDVSYRSMSSL